MSDITLIQAVTNLFAGIGLLFAVFILFLAAGFGWSVGASWGRK